MIREDIFFFTKIALVHTSGGYDTTVSILWCLLHFCFCCLVVCCEMGNEEVFTTITVVDNFISPPGMSFEMFDFGQLTQRFKNWMRCMLFGKYWLWLLLIIMYFDLVLTIEAGNICISNVEICTIWSNNYGEKIK